VNQDKRMLVACDVCGVLKITDKKEGRLIATTRGGLFYVIMVENAVCTASRSHTKTCLNLLFRAV
jgi:hypothetical protein